jgi:hypothetical protein
LADRSVFIWLSRISEQRRRSKSALREQFRHDRPRILGELFRALSHGLRTSPDGVVTSLPRMGDFLLWTTACEGAFWPAGTVAKAYEENRAEAADAVLWSDDLALVLRGWLERPEIAGKWTGTSSQLLVEMKGAAARYHVQTTQRPWPSTASALSGRLNRLAPMLRMVGIEVTLGDRTSSQRLVSFSRVQKVPESPSSPSSPSPGSSPALIRDGDDGNDDGSDTTSEEAER